jgi:cyanate permease
MIGLGETYFAAFMLAYGFSELLAGLIVSIPLVGGALLQLLTPKIVRHIGNYKQFVIGECSSREVAFNCHASAN